MYLGALQLLEGPSFAQYGKKRAQHASSNQVMGSRDVSFTTRKSWLIERANSGRTNTMNKYT
jgi:hypothetical protein